MSQTFYDRLAETLEEIEAEGLYKRERTITRSNSPRLMCAEQTAPSAMS